MKVPVPEQIYNARTTSSAQKVLQDGWTIYKAANKCKVPYNMLTDYITRKPVHKNPTSPMKLGKPFVPAPNEELKLVQYIIKM